MMDMTNTMRRLVLPAVMLCMAWAGLGSAMAQDIIYYHTDALGTPVAITNSGGTVIERRTFEPYGRQLTPTTLADGPGYTGHVSDAVTGLVYMQQRYYDPAISIFLSVDPVEAYSAPEKNFNRYRYGNGNPYKFTDPDGRQQQVTPQFFQNQGYPKTMADAQQQRAQTEALERGQSRHAVAARLDKVDAGGTAASMVLMRTPAAPAAIGTQAIAEVAAIGALIAEPTWERGTNILLGGLLTGVKMASNEATTIHQMAESAEIGKDTSTVVKEAEKTIKEYDDDANASESGHPADPNETQR